VSWDRPFDQSVPLPKGAPARTLRDAATFIRKLPRPSRTRARWQTAVQMLIDAAEARGPMMFAKMAIHRAVNRKAERVFNLARGDRSQ
jgi:hypothetical protein